MPKRTRYQIAGLLADTTVRGHHLVTSVEVSEVPGHDFVKVWNRGACSGELIVHAGDGHAIAERIIGPGHTRESDGGDPETF